MHRHNVNTRILPAVVAKKVRHIQERTHNKDHPARVVQECQDQGILFSFF